MVYPKRISVIILFILPVCLSFSQDPLNQKARVEGELLYNGIRLPQVWPPDQLNPLSDAPMEVPYLENPPAVIPIDIGRQLFVDDFLIEKTNLSRVFHSARKYEGNPIFHSKTKHELDVEAIQQAVTYLGHGGVFYDGEDEVFKMFYTAGWRGGLALATSKNLIDWKRPELGLVSDNLVLPPGPLFAGGDNAVWLDDNTKDPNARYKMIVERLVDGAWREFYEKKADAPTHTLHTSADGLIWSQGIPTGKASDYTTFFYNPFRKLWAFSIKQNTKRGRARYYSENKSFLGGRDWDASVYWTNADRLDRPDPKVGDPAQLYSLNAVAYESLILGEFYIHLGPKNSIADNDNIPKITEIKLGFSRDGFHWSRPDRNPFIAATRQEGDWDRAYLHGTNGLLLVMGDELWFPYTGYSGIAPNGSRGMYTGASIGMAILRRDGFASMQAHKKNGMLITRPVTFQGNHLFVNVNCPEGELTVEILDQDNNVIAPFSRDNCTPIRVDKTLHMVKWAEHEDFSELKGQPVKFRFQLSNGELFSFWISPDKKGASHGFLGGGSPGNKGKVDTRGVEGY